MVKLDQVSVGDIVRTFYDNATSPWEVSHAKQQARVLDVRPSRGGRPVLVEYLYWPCEGDLHWLHLDQFEILNKVGGIDMNSTSDIKVGDKVRITDASTGLSFIDDNLGELAEVIEVDLEDEHLPIRVKFLRGEWEGHCHWLSNDCFRVVEGTTLGGKGGIKEGDYVVIDTTHSEDSLLDGLHGKVVKVIEVDPSDSALPINVALPNGNSRWMYPEEFYTAPTEGFNILVDADKPKLYGDAVGKEVPVLEVDYECGQGLFFEVMYNGELMWVHYMDCSVVQDTDVASELPKEAVEFDFTVMKSYTNGAVNTFLRIDKQSEHFYDSALLTEFNTVTTADLICRSEALPDFLEGSKLLYLRGIDYSADSVEIQIPDDRLEQVVTTLVDLKAWMLNRCKQ